MTSWPERPAATGRAGRLGCGGRGPAERDRCAGVGLGCAVLPDRPLDLRAGVTVARAFGGRLRKPGRIDAHLNERGRGMRDAFDRGEKRRGLRHQDGRFPDRHVEEVLEGAPLLDVNSEVGLSPFDDEPRWGSQKRRAHPLDVQVCRLLLLCNGGMNRGSGHQKTGKTGQTTPHTVRTRRFAVRPGQEASLGIG